MTYIIAHSGSPQNQLQGLTNTKSKPHQHTMRRHAATTLWNPCGHLAASATPSLGFAMRLQRSPVPRVAPCDQLCEKSIVAVLFLVVRPGAPSNFLFLVAMPFAPSSGRSHTLKHKNTIQRKRHHHLRPTKLRATHTLHSHSHRPSVTNYLQAYFYA